MESPRSRADAALASIAAAHRAPSAAASSTLVARASDTCTLPSFGRFMSIKLGAGARPANRHRSSAPRKSPPAFFNAAAPRTTLKNAM